MDGEGVTAVDRDEEEGDFADERNTRVETRLRFVVNSVEGIWPTHPIMPMNLVVAGVVHCSRTANHIPPVVTE